MTLTCGANQQPQRVQLSYQRCNLPRSVAREGRNALLGSLLILTNPLLMTILEIELH